MSRICLHFSAFLLNVEDLRISATRPSSQENSLCSERWLELLNSFTGVKWFHLDGNHSTNIVRALQDMLLAAKYCATSPAQALHTATRATSCAFE